MLNRLEITDISTCCTKVQWCRTPKHAIVPATDRGGGDPVADMRWTVSGPISHPSILGGIGMSYTDDELMLLAAVPQMIELQPLRLRRAALLAPARSSSPMPTRSLKEAGPTRAMRSSGSSFRMSLVIATRRLRGSRRFAIGSPLT